MDNSTLGEKHVFHGENKVGLLRLNHGLVEFNDQFFNVGSGNFIFNEEFLKESIKAVRVLDSNVV